jgi:hypothetical protein
MSCCDCASRSRNERGGEGSVVDCPGRFDGEVSCFLNARGHLERLLACWLEREPSGGMGGLSRFLGKPVAVDVRDSVLGKKRFASIRIRIRRAAWSRIGGLIGRGFRPGCRKEGADSIRCHSNEGRLCHPHFFLLQSSMGSEVVSPCRSPCALACWLFRFLGLRAGLWLPMRRCRGSSI